MPKLLMIANHFIDHGGGLERVAHDLARRLVGMGHDVCLAAHGRAPEGLPYESASLRASSAVEKMTGLPVLAPHPQDLARIGRLAGQADCLVLHDNLYLTHLFAQSRARRAKVPVLIIKHTGWVHGRSAIARAAQHAVNRILVGPSLRSADKVVAVTESKRVNMQRTTGDLDIEVVPNGIDTDFFSPSVERRDVDLLFVGRFVEKKGISLMCRLAAALPDLRIACVGFGPIDPGVSGLANLEVVRSPSFETILEYYRRARLTLAPCLSEGTPLVIPESLACGTPVLASTHAAHRDLPMKTLAIDLDWPENTVASWVDGCRALLALSHDPATLRAAAVDHFSLEATCRRYDSIIGDLVSGG